MVNMNEFTKLLNQVAERFLSVEHSARPHTRRADEGVVRDSAWLRAAGAAAVALRLLIVLTVITGVLYPLAITAVAQLAFPAQANGSLVTANQSLTGSLLIGQANQEPHYFWPRPSAVDYMAGSAPDALGSSGATNFGPTNATLATQVRERDSAFRAANALAAEVAVPPDMLFASGSGLDPHISPEAARLQINRVAQARGLDPAALAVLVEQTVEPPQLGFLGQPRVNVLKLNLALDGLQ
ncbi:potassium-transporting ATPase subunit KdpC [Caldilinea sp.]|uniref:potassium-transporting ATPase subunit KdpC n=1 Tax=Caldilinea sp. TaxID=2293560 RepID=UPI002C78DA76|nr:potassium-transporting ATPase subunit KdpC [Caldilinea sp.]HRA67116.1 potassium-transporting ATPase subunit KdpC [Caldilinea sp.]